jgi:RND family efflux transporter MFP subunit
VSDEDMKAKRAQTNAQIAEAEASLYSAQKDYDRFNELYKQQSATQKELENVTLQYNSSKSRLEAAKQMRNEVNAMIAYSTITAPFSGVVTQKLAETGNIANPGMPILTIEQTGILQVSATIAESDISSVKLEDVADILVKSTGKSFKGKIIQINPSSQFTGGQYLVKVSVPDSAKSFLNPGMYVNVSIPIHHAVSQITDMILVPSSAIIYRDELTGIYTVSDDNKAMLRWIRTGKSYGDKTEVLSGLSKDERYVLSSGGRLFNGTPVSIK